MSEEIFLQEARDLYPWSLSKRLERNGRSDSIPKSEVSVLSVGALSKLVTVHQPETEVPVIVWPDPDQWLEPCSWIIKLHV